MDVWPYMPQGSLTESLEWLTDVQRCRSAEYRQSLRIKPRQELSCSYKLTAAQFGQAKVWAKALGADSLYVPLWQWATLPGPIASGELHLPKDTDDPAALTASNTKIMLWESPSKYEVLEVGINSMTPVYPYITLEVATTQAYTRPFLVPLRTAQFMQEFEASVSSSQLIECQARFRVLTCDDYSAETGALYSAESYLSRPVITDRTLATSSIREQFERRFDEVDSVVGGAYRYATFATPEQASQVAWYAQTRAGMRALTYWIHSRKGMWKSFWLPSWNKDLTVTHEIAAADTNIEIADIGFRTRATFPCDIMILTDAGARIYCHVTSASAGSAGHEVLALSAQVGTLVYTWDVTALCLLTPSRFAADRIEFTHAKGGNTSVSVPTMEVPA